MIDPERLLHAAADDFEQRLLRSAERDVGSAEALNQTLAAMGAIVGTAAAGTGVATAGLHAARAAGAVTNLGSALTAGKIVGWVVVGGLAGTLVTVSAESVFSRHEMRSTAEVRVVTRPPSAPVAPAQHVVPSAPPLPTAAIVVPTNAKDEYALPPSAARPRNVSARPPTEERASSSAPSDLPAPSRSAASFEQPRQPAAANATGSSLASELAALGRARAALNQGNAVAALSLLGDYDRQFPAGALTPEATVLRVEALLQHGESARARDLAQSFFASHPGSPHEAHLRSLLSAQGIP